MTTLTRRAITFNEHWRLYVRRDFVITLAPPTHVVLCSPRQTRSTTWPTNSRTAAAPCTSSRRLASVWRWRRRNYRYVPCITVGPGGFGVHSLSYWSRVFSSVRDLNGPFVTSLPLREQLSEFDIVLFRGILIILNHSMISHWLSDECFDCISTTTIAHVTYYIATSVFIILYAELT